MQHVSYSRGGLNHIYCVPETGLCLRIIDRIISPHDRRQELRGLRIQKRLGKQHPNIGKVLHIYSPSRKDAGALCDASSFTSSYNITHVAQQAVGQLGEMAEGESPAQILSMDRLQRGQLDVKHRIPISCLYSIVEDMDGGDVLEYLNKLPMPEMDDVLFSKVYWVSGIANALASIHHRRCIHLDVKPENMMLKHQEGGHPWESYKCLLIDFGNACSIKGPHLHRRISRRLQRFSRYYQSPFPVEGCPYVHDWWMLLVSLHVIFKRSYPPLEGSVAGIYPAKNPQGQPHIKASLLVERHLGHTYAEDIVRMIQFMEDHIDNLLEAPPSGWRAINKDGWSALLDFMTNLMAQFPHHTAPLPRLQRQTQLVAPPPLVPPPL